MIRLVVFLLLAALPLRAEQVVASLSQDRVSINANFDGSEILVFGAVKREMPIPAGSPLEVIITLSGPHQAVTMRRKSRVAGIWVNTDSVEIDAAPGFYSVSTTAPLAQVLSNTEDLRYKISIPRAIRSVGAPETIANAETFTDALIRVRKASSLYQLNESAVLLKDETLFQTSVILPANLIEGDYTTRIYLTRDGAVVNAYSTVIGVHKVGLERWLYRLAHDHALLYGLLSLAIAIGAGWGASAIFRYIKG